MALFGPALAVSTLHPIRLIELLTVFLFLEDGDAILQFGESIVSISQKPFLATTWCCVRIPLKSE